MKVVVLPAVGGSLVVEEVPLPKPRPGEVRLRVCHTDLHRAIMVMD